MQIGRTHGQHAVPITFGFAIAQFVSRFGSSILKIKKTSNNLRGKIAGAVGSYNASSLFFNNRVFRILFNSISSSFNRYNY